MRGRRMGRRGLVGTMARTAVVAGTATAVAGGVSRNQQNKAQAAQAEQQAAQAEQQAALDSQAQMADMQAQLAAMKTAPAPAADDDGDLLAELEKLGSLKASGLLTDEEFAAAKAKLLS